jgi:hypothetical protein
MDTPRDFSSPPSAIVAQPLMPLDARMERNLGLECDALLLPTFLGGGAFLSSR